jgi:nucleotide-binding universal stress UspA family protein
MLDKILISTDLSASSFNLIQCMLEAKNFGVQSIVLTHVIDMKYAVIVPSYLESESKDILRKEAEVLTSQGFPVQTDLRMGIPWPEILDSARENKVAAIVVGSHGKSIAREIVLGSVTSELIEQADLPVLIMRMNELDTEKKMRLCSSKIAHLFDNVVFPTDFSDENKQALHFVKEMGKYIKKITLIHVQEPILLEQPIEFDMQELDAIDLSRLADMEKEITGCHDKSRDVLHGIASIELADYINRGGYSLVVMGTRGLGATKRFLLGSASRYVIRHSNTPVMIVPKRP